MISITCRFAKFSMDETLTSPKEKLHDYARHIIYALRTTLQKIKPKLEKKIYESAAFVVLEQNLAEFVHNSMDACLMRKLQLDQQIITIKIPQKIKEDQVSIRYQDSSGGFSKDFMENQSALDYYADKLKGKKIYVESQKTSHTDKILMGGNGLALSQTCRFLKLHLGKLILTNKNHGGVLIFQSPIRPARKKPSFNNFKNLDYQNVFAQDKCDGLRKSTSRHDLSLLNIPTRNIRNIILHDLDSPRFNLPSTDSDSGISPWKSPDPS